MTERTSTIRQLDASISKDESPTHRTQQKSTSLFVWRILCPYDISVDLYTIMTIELSTTNQAKAAPKKKQSSSKHAAVATPTKTTITGVQKILNYAFSIETLTGNKNVPRKQIASLSGVKSNTFPVTISGMKKKGLIEYDKESIWLTDKGRSNANPVDTPVDNSSTQADIKKKYKIGGKAALLFDACTDGRVHDRAALAASVGCTNKATLAVMLCNMKKTGIIDYDRTTVQLTDLCFPFGRPTE